MTDFCRPISLSRPCRDADLLVVLSRHCEDFVLLYRVMQGLVPIGTRVCPQYRGMPIRQNVIVIFWCAGFAFGKVKKDMKFTFVKANYFVSLHFEKVNNYDTRRLSVV